MVTIELIHRRSITYELMTTELMETTARIERAQQ